MVSLYKTHRECVWIAHCDVRTGDWRRRWLRAPLVRRSRKDRARPNQNGKTVYYRISAAARRAVDSLWTKLQASVADGTNDEVQMCFVEFHAVSHLDAQSGRGGRAGRRELTRRGRI